MALDAQINWLSLLAYVTLLAFSYKTFAASSKPTGASVVCSMHTNKLVFVDFDVPKRNGRSPRNISIFYKVKDERVWKRVKTINVQEKGYPDRIEDWLAIDLLPTTRYELQIEPDISSVETADKCEFCSQTGKLEPVSHLRVHSFGSYWFALAWTMPLRTCPENVTYNIEYHNNTFPFAIMEWAEPGYPLTLSTGEQYVRITKGVRPNSTYVVTIKVQAGELGEPVFSKPSVESVQTTPLDPKYLKPEKTPFLTTATNTTLKLASYAPSACEDTCTVTWQYKELDDTAWRFAGIKAIYQTMDITGLNPSTVYQVRALFQRVYESKPYDGDDVPFLYVTTLPVLEPQVPEHSPRPIKATNTSLTMVTDCEEECRKGYIAHWEYKEPNDTTWKYAGEQYAIREITISNLTPDTSYEVRFNLQWPTGRRNYSAYGSVEETSTCSNTVKPVQYAWTSNRQLDSLTVKWWSTMGSVCDIRYLVRWKEYDEEGSDEFNRTSYDENKCPYNASLVNSTTMVGHDCFDPDYHYCYMVNESIVPGRRYVFEVVAMDAEGKCSIPEVLRTGSPLKLWGGVSFGQWTLIVVCILLLFAAVPACIICKKRIAARMAAGGGVAFSKSSDNGTGSIEENHGDMDGSICPEPSTRILDRRSDPPNLSVT